MIFNSELVENIGSPAAEFTACAAWNAVFQQSSVGVIITDLNGIITAANPAAHQMLGYVPGELIDESYMAFLHPEELNADRNRAPELLAGKIDSYQKERRFIRKNGSEIWSRATVTLIHHEGRPSYAVAMLEDIDVQHHAEVRSRLSDEILSHAGSIIVWSDPDGSVRYVSPSCRKVLGYRPEELLGRGWWEKTFCDPKAADAELDRLLERTACKGAFPLQTYERKACAKDGSVHWLRFQDSPAPGGGIIGVGQDVTELRETELAYSALFNASLDAIVLLDDDRRLVHMNPAACELFGRTLEQTMGYRISEFSDQPAQSDEKWRDFQKKGAAQGEVRILRPDGSLRTVEFHAKANVLPGRHLSILRDLTPRLELQKQLQHAQKMQAIGTLAGGIAHDFNNLLAAILGHCELLQGQLSHYERSSHGLAQIGRSATHAADLVRQLMAFGRKQMLMPVPLDLNKQVQTSIGLIRPLIHDDIALNLELAPGLPDIKADPIQIEQVLLNLAANSRDAMPAGGRITISTARLEFADSEEAPWPGIEPGEYVYLKFADTGLGMPDHVKERIFEPFYTTKEPHRGTGLGLSSAYGIVTQSGGHIWVETELGRGSIFHILLPQAQKQSVEEQGGAQEQVKILNGNHQTILLVEDEEITREALTICLQMGGYRVLSAENAAVALKLAQRHVGKIALLLTDVLMPEMNGRELSERLTRMRPETKVLFMSGYDNEVIARKGLLDPGVEFLQKPFPLKTLMRKVQALLERK